MSARNASRSSPKALTVCPVVVAMNPPPHSAVAAGDGVLRAGCARIGEDIRRVAIFHQCAEMEKGGFLTDARRLLNIVRDDQDRIFAAQFVDQLLNLGGGDRIESRTGLVHKDKFEKE